MPRSLGWSQCWYNWHNFLFYDFIYIETTATGKPKTAYICAPIIKVVTFAGDLNKWF